MNRRILRGTVIALVMVCCVAGGYLAGMKWGSPESETAPFQSESKANEYDTHMLAIVNLDEGINNDGETISYSQALLGTLDVQYEVTNLEAARQGIQDGRYSAYLIIPGTFSSAVETINTSPQKAVLEYAVSEQLTEEAKEAAIYDIGNTYTKLNDGLSEIYISSVMEEVHSVQDSTNTVIGNDEKDLAALENVRGDDLTEAIQLPELEMVENDIQVLDLTADYQENDSILGSIDDSYESAITSGSVDYDKIRGQLAVVETSQETVENERSELTDVVNSLDTDSYDDSELSANEDIVYDTKGTELLGRMSTVENAVKDMNETTPELKSYIDKLKQDKDWYTETLGKFNTLKTDETQIEESFPSGEKYNVTVQTYQFYHTSEVETLVNSTEDIKKKYANERLENYHNTVEQNVNVAVAGLENWFADNIENSGVSIEKPDWYEILKVEAPVYDLVSGSGISADMPQSQTVQIYKVSEDSYPDEDIEINLDLLPSLDTPMEPAESGQDKVEGKASDLLGDIIDTAKYGRARRTNQISSQNENTQKAFNSVKKSFSQFDLAYSDNLTEQGTLSGSVKDYDLSSYIDTETVRSLRQNLMENGTDIEGKISDQNQQYEEFVSQIYENAAENTLKQQESITEGEAASREKLETNLSDAKAGKRNTYEQNLLLLTDIQNILPYSRLGTQENQLAYRFMINPVVMEQITVKPEAGQSTNRTDVSALSESGQTGETGSLAPVILLIIAALLILAAVLGILARYAGRTRRKDTL